MMFMFELHGFRGLTLIVTPQQLLLRLGFITVSAAATTFSEQIETRMALAAAKFAYVIDQLEQNGREGLYLESVAVLSSMNKKEDTP